MLTENEIEACRILIQNNPNPDYMKKLAENDDFARSEIQSVFSILLEDAQEAIASQQAALNTMIVRQEFYQSILVPYPEEIPEENN